MTILLLLAIHVTQVRSRDVIAAAPPAGLGESENWVAVVPQSDEAIESACASATVTTRDGQVVEVSIPFCAEQVIYLSTDEALLCGLDADSLRRCIVSRSGRVLWSCAETWTQRPSHERGEALVIRGNNGAIGDRMDGLVRTATAAQSLNGQVVVGLDVYAPTGKHRPYSRIIAWTTCAADPADSVRVPLFSLLPAEAVVACSIEESPARGILIATCLGHLPSGELVYHSALFDHSGRHETLPAASLSLTRDELALLGRGSIMDAIESRVPQAIRVTMRTKDTSEVLEVCRAGDNTLTIPLSWDPLTNRWAIAGTH